MIIFTFKERLYLIGLLNKFKGSLSGLAHILEDLKKLDISQQERKEMNLREEPKGSGLLKWDNEKELEITLSEATIEYIQETIKEKDSKKDFTIEDSVLIHLLDKIKK
jgi:hypothetical protein